MSVTRVKRVFPIGPAIDSGRLREGDVILRVNGSPTRDLSRCETLHLLRTTSPDGIVELTICRPDAGVLPPIEQLVDSQKTLDARRKSSPVYPNAVAASHAQTNGCDVDGRITESRLNCVNRHHPSHDCTDTDRASHVTEDGGDRSSRNSGDQSDDGSSSHDSADEGTEGIQNGDASVGSNTASGGSGRDDQSGTETREYSVTLTKGARGLGFTIAGSAGRTGLFYVKEVLYEPALSAQQIRTGDRLVKVDDQYLTEMSHKEAIGFLRATASTVLLHFCRRRGDGSQAERVTATGQGARHGKRKISTKDESCADKGLVVADDEKAAIGVSEMIRKMEIQRLNDTQDSRDEDGEERNETRDGTKRRDPLLTTASSWGDITLPMSSNGRDDVDGRRPSSDSLGGGGVLTIELVKAADGGSLGFSLVQAGKRRSAALLVKSITMGGVAWRDGRLRVGDRLLQVNGESVIEMAHSKAVCLIRNATSVVTLSITRPAVTDADAPVSRDTTRPISRHESANLDELVIANLPTGRARRGRGGGSADSDDGGHDTDSDIDSAMLDSEAESRLDAATRDEEEVDEVPRDADDGDDASSWVTQSEDVSEEERRDEDVAAEEDDLHRDEPDDKIPAQKPSQKPAQKPQKPPRRSALSRLPSDAGDTWLRTLALVRPAAQTLHYTGRQLAERIRQLRRMVARDEPVDEYKSLRRVKPTDNCNEARRPENKTRNRYRNVLPYDETRVRLAGNSTDDYINASHVRHLVGNDRLAYIACQGPMAATTPHFWAMVWQQRADTIAMVTLDTEAGKVKCHRYWPDSVDAPPMVIDGRLQVSLTQVHTFANFIVHHIRMTDLETGHEHRVTHLNFTTWPDLGTPKSAIPLLQYMAFMHLVHQSGPVVVHCSAGIGRTGALITIDIVLTLIHRDLQFDIQKIVQEIRHQRQGMIQTKDQYTFCYQACLEALQTLTQT